MPAQNTSYRVNSSRLEAGRRIGYARVSTDDQHLDLQFNALKKANCERVFTDQGISGKVKNRPGLKKSTIQPKKGRHPCRMAIGSFGQVARKPR